MRVVIDMQGAQTESRFRGIGRYTMGLALGLARNAGEHEILLAVNGSLGESADAIEQAVKDVLKEGWRTADIAQADSKAASTAEMGSLIAEKIR